MMLQFVTIWITNNYEIKITTHKITILVMIFKLSQMGNGVDVHEKHHYMNVKKSKELNLNFAFL